MNRKLSVVVTALLMVAMKSNAMPAPTTLLGHWVVDLNPMLKQAAQLHTSKEKVSEMVELFSGGKMNITEKQIILSVSGVQQTISYDYETLGKKGSCYTMITICEGATRAVASV